MVCYNTGGNVSVTASTSRNNACVGGIAGCGGTISNCYNTGSVTVTSSSDRTCAGGIAGSGATISNCYNTGSVTAASSSDTVRAGGIVGEVYSATVTGCYNTGSVSAASFSADAYAGGIAGSVDEDGTITSCYYMDSLAKGVGDGTDTATKRTDAQMRAQASFGGFDFDTVWTMAGNSEYPYPELLATPMQVAISDPYALTIDVSSIKNPTRALWVDGVEYSGSKLRVSGNSYSVDLPNGKATNAIVYTYNSLTEPDVHKVYPTSMTVWLLSYDSSGYHATRAPRFDNILQYAGSSIRITGVKGIRMITSISTATKNALMGSGINGYKLVEYGTAVAWVSEMGADALVLGKSYTKMAYAYRRGDSDPVYKQVNGLTQYTNVLVGFTNAKCVPDLAMRPYIILEAANGTRITLYGGTVERSIGYIAYQNRSAFAPGTASYSYIWSIIHYVYGKTYDSEYRG